MSARSAILVAEDDSNDAILLQQAFLQTQSPTQVSFVGDGHEAIKHLQNRLADTERGNCPLPSLLLVDLRMPRVDGFDLLAWVRSQPALKQMRVGVLSGMEHKPELDRAYALGADFCINKPQEFNELVNVARELLALCSVPREQGVPQAPYLSAPEFSPGMEDDR